MKKNLFVIRPCHTFVEKRGRRQPVPPNLICCSLLWTGCRRKLFSLIIPTAVRPMFDRARKNIAFVCVSGVHISMRGGELERRSSHLDGQSVRIRRKLLGPL